MCHTFAHVLPLLRLKRMSKSSPMSQCLPWRTFNHSIIKVVVLLIQSHECLPSATNDGGTSHSFHILGNPPFTSSVASGLGGEFDQFVPISPQFHILDCAAGLAQSPPTVESTSAGSCSWHGIITGKSLVPGQRTCWLCCGISMAQSSLCGKGWNTAVGYP